MKGDGLLGSSDCSCAWMLSFSGLLAGFVCLVCFLIFDHEWSYILDIFNI